jgi:O-antigen ligase
MTENKEQSKELQISKLGLISQKIIAILVYVMVFLPLVFFWSKSSNGFLLPKNSLFLWLSVLLLFCLIVFLCETKNKKFTKKQKILFGILSVWVLFKLISLIFSPDKAVSFFGGISRFEGVILSLGLVVFLLGFLEIFRESKKPNKFLLIFSLFAGLLAFYGLMQKVGLFLFHEQWVDGDVTRVVSTFGNPLYLSAFLIPAIFITFYCLRQKENKKMRFELIIVLICQVSAIYLTESSSAYLTLIFCAILFFIGFFWSKKKFLAIGALVFLVLLSGFLAMAISGKINFPGRAGEVLSDFTVEKASNIQRLFVWQSAWRAFTEKPWFGWGNEMFVEAFNHNRNTALISPLEANFDRSHNAFLDTLALEGIFVFISFLSLLAYALLVAIKKYRKEKNLLDLVAIIIIFSHCLNFFFSIPVLANYLCLFLAIGFIFYNQDDQKLELRKTSTKVIPVYFVLGIVFVFLISYLTRPIQSAVYYQVATTTKNPTTIDLYFEKALKKWSWPEMVFDRLNYQKFLIEQSENQESLKEESQNFIDRWSDKYGYSFRFSLAAGQICGFFDEEKMTAYFEDALKRAPASYETYWAWGNFHFFQNNYDTALEKYRQAIAIDPNQSYPYFKLAELYRLMGDSKKQQEFKDLYDLKFSGLNYKYE